MCHVLEVVFINEFVWDEFHWHSHAFFALHRGVKVKIVCIDCHELCKGGRQDAVPWNFSSCHVSSVHVSFTGVIDEVANHHCDLHAMWVIFLAAEVGNNASASDNAIWGHLFDFIDIEETDGVCSNGAVFASVRKMA